MLKHCTTKIGVFILDTCGITATAKNGKQLKMFLPLDLS